MYYGCRGQKRSEHVTPTRPLKYRALAVQVGNLYSRKHCLASLFPGWRPPRPRCARGTQRATLPLVFRGPAKEAWLSTECLHPLTKHCFCVPPCRGLQNTDIVTRPSARILQALFDSVTGTTVTCCICRLGTPWPTNCTTNNPSPSPPHPWKDNNDRLAVSIYSSTPPRGVHGTLGGKRKQKTRNFVQRSKRPQLCPAYTLTGSSRGWTRGRNDYRDMGLGKFHANRARTQASYAPARRAGGNKTNSWTEQIILFGFDWVQWTTTIYPFACHQVKELATSQASLGAVMRSLIVLPRHASTMRTCILTNMNVSIGSECEVLASNERMVSAKRR